MQLYKQISDDLDEAKQQRRTSKEYLAVQMVCQSCWCCQSCQVAVAEHTHTCGTLTEHKDTCYISAEGETLHDNHMAARGQRKIYWDIPTRQLDVGPSYQL